MRSRAWRWRTICCRRGSALRRLQLGGRRGVSSQRHPGQDRPHEHGLIGPQTRAPFLDHELASWTLRLPEHLAVGPARRAQGAPARRRAPHLRSRCIADRPKRGFSIPVHAWIRGPLSEVVRDLLAPRSVASLGVLDPAARDRRPRRPPLGPPPPRLRDLGPRRPRGLAPHARGPPTGGAVGDRAAGGAGFPGRGLKAIGARLSEVAPEDLDRGQGRDGRRLRAQDARAEAHGREAGIGPRISGSHPPAGPMSTDRAGAAARPEGLSLGAPGQRPGAPAGGSAMNSARVTVGATRGTAARPHCSAAPLATFSQRSWRAPFSAGRAAASVRDGDHGPDLGHARARSPSGSPAPCGRP